jgi:hypothetical protein
MIVSKGVCLARKAYDWLERRIFGSKGVFLARKAYFWLERRITSVTVGVTIPMMKQIGLDWIIE